MLLPPIEEDKKANIPWIIIILGICALLYLLVQASMATGAHKYRTTRECVSPAVMAKWQLSVELATGVCTDASGSFIESLEQKNAEVVKWRDAYYSLKRKVETPPVDEGEINN